MNSARYSWGVSAITVVFILNWSLTAAFASSGSPGKIDLGDWNPKSQGTQNLDGEWYFFDNELLQPNEVIARLASHQIFAEVPSAWTGESKRLDENGFGYATYVLQLTLPGEADFWLESYGLQSTGTVQIIDIDGTVLARGDSGSVGTTRSEAYAINWFPVEVEFERDTTVMQNVYHLVHVANFIIRLGGSRNRCTSRI